MLSGFQGENKIAFEKIFREIFGGDAPGPVEYMTVKGKQKLVGHRKGISTLEAPVIVDLTVGEGRAWELIPLARRTNFYGFDIRKTSLTTKIHDISKPLPLLDRCADLVYFDPPFFFRTGANDESPYNPTDYSDVEAFADVGKFNQILENLSEEVPRVLKEKGFFLAQIMDMYKGPLGTGRYYPTHYKVLQMCLQFKPQFKWLATFDIIIKKRGMAYGVLANVVHYYLFRKMGSI